MRAHAHHNIIYIYSLCGILNLTILLFYKCDKNALSNLIIADAAPEMFQQPKWLLASILNPKHPFPNVEYKQIYKE